MVSDQPVTRRLPADATDKLLFWRQMKKSCSSACGNGKLLPWPSLKMMMKMKLMTTLAHCWLWRSAGVSHTQHWQSVVVNKNRHGQAKKWILFFFFFFTSTPPTYVPTTQPPSAASLESICMHKYIHLIHRLRNLFFFCLFNPICPWARVLLGPISETLINDSLVVVVVLDLGTYLDVGTWLEMQYHPCTCTSRPELGLISWPSLLKEFIRPWNLTVLTWFKCLGYNQGQLRLATLRQPFIFSHLAGLDRIQLLLLLLHLCHTQNEMRAAAAKQRMGICKSTFSKPSSRIS